VIASAVRSSVIIPKWSRSISITFDHAGPWHHITDASEVVIRQRESATLAPSARTTRTGMVSCGHASGTALMSSCPRSSAQAALLVAG
jgi:hypothetical protein